MPVDGGCHYMCYAAFTALPKRFSCYRAHPAVFISDTKADVLRGNKHKAERKLETSHTAVYDKKCILWKKGHKKMTIL